ncbi:MAG: 50S ribosomal protein L9 [Vicinamibacterales bacterium]
MVELILKQDVEHLGRRGDIVKVSDGYARNFLLPRKMALALTVASKRQVEHERKMALAREAEERSSADALASRIGHAALVIARKVGETDTLYGSVTSSDVAEALAAQGIDIDRRKIQLADPIKRLGEHVVPIRLHRDVTAQAKVHVVKDQA